MGYDLALHEAGEAFALARDLGALSCINRGGRAEHEARPRVYEPGRVLAHNPVLLVHLANGVRSGMRWSG